MSLEILLRALTSQNPIVLYYINGSTHNHKDLGIIINDNLNWNDHHDIILNKAYRTLGLVRRTFSGTISISAKAKLYISLIRSQVLHCSPIWQPHLIKDIKKLETLQRRATKFI